eukprot:152081-Chlamydomonas_euryale.AAC.1
MTQNRSAACCTSMVWNNTRSLSRDQEGIPADIMRPHPHCLRRAIQTGVLKVGALHATPNLNLAKGSRSGRGRNATHTKDSIIKQRPGLGLGL